MNESIAVILPVYNKQNSLPVVYNQLISALEKGLMSNSFKLIFVDDASTDSSISILRNLKQNDNRVELIELDHNVGQLKAMEIGLAKADADILVFTSSDTQNPIENIVTLCRAIQNGHDLAIGYRESSTERDPSSYLSRIFYGVLKFFINGMPPGGFDMGAFDSGLAVELRKLDFGKIAIQGDVLRLAKNPFYTPITRNTDKLDTSNWKLGQKIMYALKFARYINWLKVFLFFVSVTAICLMVWFGLF
ncbi:MAG: glycosyltransferase [Flavobacteriales bacterium]|nr:glycosyltransferase [Flavobacteriales bacterium]